MQFTNYLPNFKLGLLLRASDISLQIYKFVCLFFNIFMAYNMVRRDVSLCRGRIFLPPSLLSIFSFSLPYIKWRAEESWQGDSMFLVFILGTGITKYIQCIFLCRGRNIPPSLLSFFSFSFPCVKWRAEESGQGDSMFLVFILGTGITKYIQCIFLCWGRNIPPCLFSILFLHLWNKHVYHFFCIKNGYLSFIVKSEEFDMAGRRVNKNSKVGISFSRFLIRIVHHSYCCLFI